MYLLQAVRVRESVGYNQARALSQTFIKNNRKTYWHLEDNCFVFRNIAFRHMTNLRYKQVNDNITLVFGDLKSVKQDSRPTCKDEDLERVSEGSSSC